MQPESSLTRRTFIKTAALGTVTAGTGRSISQPGNAAAPAGRQIPLKIGIRAASMKMVGDFDVIRTAAKIPGLTGVELQVTRGTPNLRDPDALLRYKKEADRWAMRVPSLAGVWDRGVQVHSPAAGESLVKSIRAAEMLGSSVILAAFFRENAPDMTQEASYGPVVSMLGKAAKHAADAGVTIGLENSLSPANNKKLVDLIDHPAVGVYYDLYNMAHYGHAKEAIPGVKLLGKKRIAMVHVKNGPLLIEEPGMIDWAAAFRAFNEIRYDGWYVYETAHDDVADCIEDTKRNNLFLKKHVQMPTA